MLPYKNLEPIDQTRVIMHIDFNSFFATVEQQANPRLRGKPIGVTGGDRLSRTVLGAASVEAKKYGVKTGMRIPEALKLCPSLILVRGDSDKYLECTKRFLGIIKVYSDKVEIFSIDEVFLELNIPKKPNHATYSPKSAFSFPPIHLKAIATAQEIKQRIRQRVGEWITCSIGISYNKLLAKFAGSLYKPDGLVVIEDPESAMQLLNCVELDEVCGIGSRTKKRLHNMGVFSFADLRNVSKAALQASFKSYGLILYNWARGIDHAPVIPFFEKEEVKSVGHRHTISHDIQAEMEIKPYFMKLSELVARRLRSKKLVGKTINVWYRAAFNQVYLEATGHSFYAEGMQTTVSYTCDGLEIYNAAWGIFQKIWQKEAIRMVGVSVSGLKPQNPENLTFLEEANRTKIITQALDKINDRYGEFTLQRGALLQSTKMKRMPNPFLSDRRFKL